MRCFRPALYLLIHLVEGETITPMLLARRFTLNPVLVIGSLFFWHSVWGIPGAFLAVPLLATVKIVCAASRCGCRGQRLAHGVRHHQRGQACSRRCGG